MAKSFTTVINPVRSEGSVSFYREPDHGLISGICAGLASSLHVPLWIVRCCFIFLLVSTGFIPMTILYLLFTLALERRPVSWEKDQYLYKAGIQQLQEMDDRFVKFSQRLTNLEYFILSDDFNSRSFNNHDKNS